MPTESPIFTIAAASVAQRLASGELRFGDVLRHDEIHHILGVPPDWTGNSEEQRLNLRFLFMTLFRAFRRELLREHKIALRLRKGEGRELVPPTEQTGYAMQEGRDQIRKAIADAKDLVTYVRVEKLSPEQRAERNNALARLGDYERALPRKRDWLEEK